MITITCSTESFQGHFQGHSFLNSTTNFNEEFLPLDWFDILPITLIECPESIHIDCGSFLFESSGSSSSTSYGQIIGHINHTGYGSCNPVAIPEPSSASMLLIGLAFITFRRR